MVTCPNCQSAQVYRTKKAHVANGGYGPFLLPKLHPGTLKSILANDKMYVTVCAECGRIDLFADHRSKSLVVDNPQWELLR